MPMSLINGPLTAWQRAKMCPTFVFNLRQTILLVSGRVLVLPVNVLICTGT